MAGKTKHFDRVSLASLFHSGFTVTADDLILHLMFAGDLTRFAERSLLTDLLFRYCPDRLPQLKPGQLQRYWDDLTARLDYVSDESVREFLGDLDLTIADVAEPLTRYLRVEEFLDRYIARASASKRVRNDILWQSFADGSLRSHIVREASTEIMASKSDLPITRADEIEARGQTETRVGMEWAAFEDHVIKRWKVPSDRFHAYASRRARALRATRK